MGYLLTQSGTLTVSMIWDIGKINGLLWADFLVETAGWTGESRKVVTDCSKKLSAAIIAKRVQDQLKVHRVSLKMVGPVGLEPTTNRLWGLGRVRRDSYKYKRKDRKAFFRSWFSIYTSPNRYRTAVLFEFASSRAFSRVISDLSVKKPNSPREFASMCARPSPKMESL